MRSLIVRLRVVNSELRHAERKLDEPCTAIGETSPAPGQGIERHDVTILKSLPGLMGGCNFEDIKVAAPHM